jgi:NitT/TauT family transport system permease protein
MADQPTPDPPPLPGGTGPADPWPARQFNDLFALRKPAPISQVVFFAAVGVAVWFGLWWYVTRGDAEMRILPLPSPQETFASFHELWFDRELTRNAIVTLRRLALGFGLAALVGVPLGVLCGCYSRLNAFFLPLSIFGRNIPVAALIPLTFSLFGIGELQKVMFIFIACVAFVLSDTARAIHDVSSAYVDTAYTLGASRWQVILKVLVPLAMPSVFNSLRLLFGLAFGYIMLAELIKFGDEAGGLGYIINISQRLRQTEHILLILMLIPLVALAIDRVLFWIQRELFPHRYGGRGILNAGVRALFHVWENLKGLFLKPPDFPHLMVPQTSGSDRGAK